LDGVVLVDTSDRQRPALDVAGNGRFANTLLERAEEERDHRLDVTGKLDDPHASAEDLQAITGDDVRSAANNLLRKLEIDLSSSGASWSAR
jgi:hypothetical protein